MSRSRPTSCPDSLTWSLQALLVRHESYVADAELERRRMTSALSKLESANAHLESDNETLTTENKALVRQVESLNTAVTSSDTHINNLTATLHSTQHEVQRLNVLASRAQHLEAQLTQLEAEQERLQNTLLVTREDERMAAQRWRESQRVLADLTTQMEQIEREAAEERLRHAEVVERMDRRATVEKELGSAALRLKSAAGQDKRANNEVVSNFVKEILSDNATLQLSMVELQELLASTRDEAELLRDQLADAHADTNAVSPFRRGLPLSREIPNLHERNASSELHVHHHYHAPQPATAPAAKARAQIPVRQRRKRSSLSSGPASPSLRSWSPQRYSRMHSTNGSLSSLHRPGSPRRNKRWSAASAQTQSSMLSSVPSSPRSTSIAPSTIFERAYPDDATIYSATEYSRPTSPESAGYGSPDMQAACPKDGPDDPMLQTFSLPCAGFTFPSRAGPNFGSVREEDEADQPCEDADVALPPNVTLGRGSPSRSPVRSPARSPIRGATADSSRPPTRLRRKTSQSSLYSISGMDIHSSFTPASPTPMSPGTYKRPAVLHRGGPSSYVHSGPILTAATVQAKADRRRYASGVGRTLLENIGPGAREDKETVYSPLSDTFGSVRGWKVGGWLSGRWKTSASAGDLRDVAAKQDTAGGLESVSEVAGEAEAAPPQATVSDSMEWHNEEARKRLEANGRGKELPAGRSLKRAKGSVLQSELDEASLRECLDEDAVV